MALEHTNVSRHFTVTITTHQLHPDADGIVHDALAGIRSLVDSLNTQFRNTAQLDIEMVNTTTDRHVGDQPF